MTRKIRHLRYCPRCLQQKPETLLVFKGISTRLTDWGQLHNFRGELIEVCPDCYADAMRFEPLYKDGEA
jgi:hypothetical protein